MLIFKRINTIHIQIRDKDSMFIGEYMLFDGHWQCTLNQAIDRPGFEAVLKKFQTLHSFEPPYYKDGMITITSATGPLKRYSFPIETFVRVDRVQTDNVCIIITQTIENGIIEILSIDSKEDIEGAVEYGKKRISTKGTSFRS